MMMINNSSVIFMSRVQNRVSLSTAKAESVVFLLCVQEVLGSKSLLLEMEIKMTIQSTIRVQLLLRKLKPIKFVKHNDKRDHSVCDQVKTKVIQVEHIETKLQLAIFLMKAISTKKVQFLVAKSYFLPRIVVLTNTV